MRKIRNVLAGLTAIMGLAMVAYGGAPPAEASGPCEASQGNCCACNAGGDCIAVQHQGVASCTFEFCSSTPCSIIE